MCVCGMGGRMYLISGVNHVRNHPEEEECNQRYHYHHLWAETHRGEPRLSGYTRQINMSLPTSSHLLHTHTLNPHPPQDSKCCLRDVLIAPDLHIWKDFGAVALARKQVDTRYDRHQHHSQ